MFDKASLKLGLDKAILQSMNTSQGGKEINNKQLSKKEIEDLLKKGNTILMLSLLFRSVSWKQLKKNIPVITFFYWLHLRSFNTRL